MLFQIEHLKVARTNWNIRLEHALKENLLGVLAGDFSYSLHPDCGLHLLMRKDELLETVQEEGGFTEQWKMTCEDVYFTNGKGEAVRNLPDDVQSLFVAWPLEERQDHSDTHITMSYVVSQHSSLFAHMALVHLLRFEVPQGQGLDWRSLLHRSQIVRGVEDFRSAVTSAMECSIVRTILHQQPHTKPEFLGEDNPAEQRTL